MIFSSNLCLNYEEYSVVPIAIHVPDPARSGTDPSISVEVPEGLYDNHNVEAKDIGNKGSASGELDKTGEEKDEEWLLDENV